MKIDRLIAIIMVLLDREKISAASLADMFEVSQRTIYRDLDTINQAGIPILSTSGPNGGVEILKSYKIEKRLFSTSDITALLMGLGNIQCNIPNSKVVETLAKVKGMVPPENQRELDFHTNQIRIDVNPWLYTDVLSDLIELIRIALEKHQLLRFDYRDIRNQNSSREIEPYRLLLKGEEWYIQGYCLSREDFRTFKLIRMQNVCILEETFEIRDFPYERMNTSHFHDAILSPAKLRIHKDILDSVISRFGKECLSPDGPEYYIADVIMPADDLACTYLLGFGDQCICLAPESLRKKMRELSEHIYRFYH